MICYCGLPCTPWERTKLKTSVRSCGSKNSHQRKCEPTFRYQTFRHAESLRAMRSHSCRPERFTSLASRNGRKGKLGSTLRIVRKESRVWQLLSSGRGTRLGRSIETD